MGVPHSTRLADDMAAERYGTDASVSANWHTFRLILTESNNNERIATGSRVIRLVFVPATTFLFKNIWWNQIIVLHLQRVPWDTDILIAQSPFELPPRKLRAIYNIH